MGGRWLRSVSHRPSLRVVRPPFRRACVNIAPGRASAWNRDAAAARVRPAVAIPLVLRAGSSEAAWSGSIMCPFRTMMPIRRASVHCCPVTNVRTDRSRHPMSRHFWAASEQFLTLSATVARPYSVTRDLVLHASSRAVASGPSNLLKSPFSTDGKFRSIPSWQTHFKIEESSKRSDCKYVATNVAVM
jgi:hypothetical protein